MSAKFFARTTWSRLGPLGVGPRCCCGEDFLVDSFEVSADGVLLAGVSALLVALVLHGGFRPSCRVCRVSNIGPDSIGEGDRGKGAAWGSEDASRGPIRWVVFAGDVACVEVGSCGLHDVV